jgi:hypothetical protein
MNLKLPTASSALGCDFSEIGEVLSLVSSTERLHKFSHKVLMKKCF